MTHSIMPEAHPDPWVNLLQGYVSDTVRALAEGGLRVQASWLDPSDPRDATILYAPGTAAEGTAPVRALVWDEETGWRDGGYASGYQGERTLLREPGYLGGGVIAAPAEVSRRVLAGGVPTRRRYRSYRDLRDGLDDALRDR